MVLKLKEKIDLMRFFLCGKIPWTAGYYLYKADVISSAIASKILDVSKLPEGFGYRVDERVIEYPWFFSRLESAAGNLLDAGSALNFDFAISHEKLKNKKITIMTLAPENNCFHYLGVSYIFGDLRETFFKDESFDFVASISTIEHIGLDNSMLYACGAGYKESSPELYLNAVKEFKRVLKKGGKIYITVPYGKYKNYGWQQIFTHAMIEKVKKIFDPSSFVETYFQYSPSGWINSNADAAKDCEYFNIHEEKKCSGDFAAAARAVACLEMTK